MCGIAGFFFDESIPVQKGWTAIDRMLVALRHRGPDDSGWVAFNDQGLVLDRSASTTLYGGLVHTRLSIIDLSERAHQPMSCPSGRYWIVYNGEVYNYRDIRQELIACGWHFRSESDTEVVLYAYLQWGAAALEKLNGMFAFACFDRQAKELFCARDRIGIKPFYFVSTDGLFLFASDVTTLIASGLYEPQVNWEGVVHGIAFRGAPRPMTVYQDVQALAPGHYRFGVVPRLARETCYWDLPIGQHSMMSEQEALEQFETALKRAVARCLVADVEVATLMSGGVDSTTLSALAAEQHPNIRAFTLDFDPSMGLISERAQAIATAKRHPLRHQMTVVSSEEIASSLDDMLWTFEEPMGFLEPHYLMAKQIASQGIKVVLNGLGPDELLGGYQYYRMQVSYWPLLKQLGFIAPLLPDSGRLLKIKKLMQARDPWDIYYGFFANSLWETPSALFEESHGFTAFDSRLWMRRFLNQAPASPDPLQALSYADIKLYIGTHHNHTCDRFLMRHQIEGRFPYLDHELVEFCYRLPPQFKYRLGEGKVLLRRLAARYIDPSCLHMKKRGFGIPELAVFNSSMQQMLIERATALRRRGIFKPQLVSQVIREWNQSSVHAQRLLYLSHFELWYQWFIEKKHPLFG